VTEPCGAALGILGGTFNPPHLGHLAVARHALSQLTLERVILMPAAIPPHKEAVGDPGGEHRLEMCRLLIADTPGLSVSSLELQRGGPSYTVDTLRAIHSSHPDAKLTFIVGADIANTLPGWHEPAALLELAEIVIVDRDGFDHDQLLNTLAPMSSTERVRFLQMGTIDVSSSQVRTRITQGEEVEDLLGPAVTSYVERHRLYRPAVLEGRS
jgi:nicotinate-nucleotide adenylyltransferase